MRCTYVNLNEKKYCLNQKGSTLKGQNLLPTGANSYFQSRPPLQNGGKTILTELSQL